MNNNTAQVRSDIVGFLRRELIGPDPRSDQVHLNMGEEILRPQDPPRLRYSAGILFPGTARIELQDNANPDEVDSAESGPPDTENEMEEVALNGGASGTDDQMEHEVNRANEFLPSAMGLTALVRLSKRLKVTVRAGRYERIAQQGLGKQDEKGNWQPQHWRKAVTPAPLEIDCSLLKASKPLTKEFPLAVEGHALKLSLHIYSRPYAHAEDPATDRIVTFTLINRTQMSGNSPKDSECFFQCEFAVEDADGGPCFLEYPEREGLADDDEERSLRLLYRHRKTFAVGHGCAAQWSEVEVSAISQIKTDALPVYEIKPILPREIRGLELSMLKLSSQEASSITNICERLAEEYNKWIDRQNATVQAVNFPEECRAAAFEHLKVCRQCHQRIVDGIELLKTDADTRLAFAWMNKAMLEQQLHYDLAANHRRTWKTNEGTLSLEKSYTAPDTSNPPKGKGLWRPFQLTFILMNLRSIAQL